MLYILVLLYIMVLCGGFAATSPTPAQKTAEYFKISCDSLALQLRKFQKVAGIAEQSVLKQHFFGCRMAYKRVEFFIDLFDPLKARAFNGPDVLRIEEENPRDSIKPHGLQVVERMLWHEPPERQQLVDEIALLVKQAEAMVNDKDAPYYFKDELVWKAMRLGTFRIISLGITGFDVPLSDHALPEARAALRSMRTVAGFYKKSIGDSVYEAGSKLFQQAERYLGSHNVFGTFDRAAFIRNYLNPISAWQTMCTKDRGYINVSERNPLSSSAATLFSPDIMNLTFFSPNSDYRVTPERVKLGKKLFYDPILSGNGNRSCGSCHKPELAFTDGLAKPMDMSGERSLLRNTPTLWNVALQTRQFYDSRTDKLENQLSAVVHNADEMQGSLKNSIGKLLADKEYAQLFAAAYSHSAPAVTEYNIANAISSYVRTLISMNSRFDKYMRNEGILSAAEKNGFNLFMGKAKCGTCHYAPVFNGLTPPLYEETESEILAVPANNEQRSQLDGDQGKYNYTKVALHRYAFKTPTVRNAALTAPYMHNGVFKTLEEVINFYNDGGGAGRGIVLETQTLPGDRLRLTKKEVADIVAFLNCLTDTSGTSFKF